MGVLILCSACLSMFPHLAVEFLQMGIALLSGMLGGCWAEFVTAAATFSCPEHQPKVCGARGATHPPTPALIIPWENSPGKRSV